MSTPSTITINSPPDVTFLFTGTRVADPVTDQATITGPILHRGNTTVTGNNWTVFIPYGSFSTSRIVDPQLLLSSLSNATPGEARTFYSILVPLSGAAVTTPVPILGATPPPITLEPFASLFVPLPTPSPNATNVDIAAFAAKLSTSTPPTTSATTASPSSGPSAPTSSSASPTSGPTSSSVISGSTTSTTPANTTTPGPIYSNDPSLAAVSKGGLAGIIIGVALLALLSGLLLGLLWERKRSAPSKAQGYFKPLDDTPVMAGAAFGRKDTHEMTEIRPLATWQKHAKQGEAEGSLKRKVSSLFDLVEVHVGEFYGAAQTSSTTRAFDSLQVLSPNDFSTMAPKSIETPALLKGMLNRCIVHMISLQSDPAQSLLPSEYTQLPGKIKWYMEQDGKDIDHSAELRPGFAEALATWRVLVVLLLSHSADDAEVKRGSETRIQAATVMIDNAMSPWQSPTKSEAKRTENLRSILRVAADLGMLLFTHPESYAFNWNAPQEKHGLAKSVVYSPAFEHRLGEFGQPLSQPKILVASKQVSTRSKTTASRLSQTSAPGRSKEY